MSKKRCRKCYELNGSNEMICIHCNNTLSDAEIVEEPLENGVKGPIGGGTVNMSSYPSKYDPNVVSLGIWIGIFILTAIPVINLITLCYLAFGDHPETLKNYGKAALIFAIVGGILLFLIRL